MRPISFLCLGILLAAASAAPVSAGIPVTREMVCPIGGDRFDFTTTPSYSTWGGRPDGMPYGSWHFPLDLPECPNGLIVYKQEFSPEERERLAAVIARPDYRALADEAQYYRLHWLMREMGEPPLQHLWVLVQAGWQVPVDSAERRRYQEEFVARMAALGEEPRQVPDFAMRARWINALRELGRFDEGTELLARTSLEALRDAADDDRRESEAWMAQFEMLRTLLARRDSNPEPLDYIGPRTASRRCADKAVRTEWDRAFCARASN